MTSRALAFLLCAAALAAAKPPRSENFERMDDLAPMIAKLIHDLQKAEEFEKKPRWEKMIIRFHQGAKTFEGKDLEGEDLVEDVLEKWPAAQVAKPDEATLKILETLPAALEERFARGIEPDRRARKKAARRLVKLLMDQHLHIRAAAIESLKKMYANSGLLYQPDASPNDRKTRQRDWDKYIRKR